MKAEDATATLELALQASGLEQVEMVHRPRLLLDNGSSCISADLASWLEAKSITHVRGALSYQEPYPAGERLPAKVICRPRSGASRRTTITNAPMRA